MDLNKGISTPIAIGLIIVISAVVGVLVWQFAEPAGEPTPKQPSDYTIQSSCQEAGYYWYEEACHEEKRSETADWKKLAERVVKNYGEALKTRKREEVLPYTTGELKEDYQEKSPVFGMSNPHPDGIEILSSEKVNSSKFKVQARSYEAYTGEGRIGYSDNTYIVEKIGNEYLISKVKRGEYVDITEKEPDSSQAKALEVISPNGGEQFKPGDSYNITWKSSLKTDEVAINICMTEDSYETHSPEQRCVVEDKLTNNDGSFSGQFGDQVPEGNYIVRIDHPYDTSTSNIHDTSDDYFTISQK